MNEAPSQKPPRLTVRERRAEILVSAVLEWNKKHELIHPGRLDSWMLSELRALFLEILP